MVAHSSSPTTTRSPVAALALASTGALVAARLLTPTAASSGPVVCPFRLATGLPCPGCGMTRAWVFLAHGDLGAAVSANPFALVTMPAAVGLVLVGLLALVRRRPLPDLGGVIRWPATKVAMAAWLAYAVVRMIAVASGHASS
jgi:apolipoprotein N-acyltransferase